MGLFGAYFGPYWGLGLDWAIFGLSEPILRVVDLDLRLFWRSGPVLGGSGPGFCPFWAFLSLFWANLGGEV